MTTTSSNEPAPAPPGCRGRPCRAITADHADQPGERELRGQRRGQRAGPVRVVRGVDQDRRRRVPRTRSSRPGDATAANAVPHRGGVQRCRWRRRRRMPRPRPARARRWRPGARRPAAGRCPRRTPPRPCRVSRCPPTANSRSRHAELAALPGDLRIRPRRSARPAPRPSLRSCAAEHRDRAGLDDPGLVPGDLESRRAQVLGVVQADRRDHRDVAVDDVGGVPGAAEPDLDDPRPPPGRRRTRRTPWR